MCAPSPDNREVHMFRRAGVVLATLVLSIAAAPAIASAAEPPIFLVGPDQYFSGLVNDQSANATIRMACPGPVGGSGHPVAGQTIGVTRVYPPFPGPVDTIGYTGTTANSIVARQLNSAATAAIATFTFYADQALSTKVFLPCGGTGTILFAPAPNSGGRPASVKVTFISIGA
jgi:hypothetical protein